MSMAQRLREESQRRLGTRIGQWQLEALLGFGAAAAVYRATSGERAAAVKTLHEELQRSDKIRKRFQREAKLTARLSSPHIVEVFEIGTTESGELFMAMELLDGVTLDRFLRNIGGRLKVGGALLVTEQLLAALSVCHEQEVVHRDIKPANIFITRQRQVKLFDLGVAHVEVEQSDQKLTMDGTVLGTPSYMAPEQARGRLDMLDARTDTFAVGAVLYTMLTGGLIHDASSAEESLILAATRPAESIARVMPDLPAEVIGLVDRALAWNPARRFQSAREMHDAIRELRGEPPAPPPPRPSEANVEQAVAMLDATNPPDDRSEVEESALQDLASRAEVMFQSVERALDSVRKYSWEHAEAKHQLERAFAGLLECIAAFPEQVVFRLRPYSFLVEEKVVWEPKEPFDAVPYNLFSSGIRSIQLRPGITRAEFDTLLRVIILDPRKDLPPEDDLATILWDQHMEHVQIQMVSSFRLDDPQEQERFVASCEEAHEQLTEGLLPARMMQSQRARLLMSMGKDVLAEAQGQAHNNQSQRRDAEQLPGALSAQELGRLANALAQGAPVEQQLPFILADAYNEVLGTEDAEPFDEHLRDFLARDFLRKRAVEGLQVYARLCACISDRALRQELTRKLFTQEQSASVLKLLAAQATSEDEAERAQAVSPHTIEHLKELLTNLDGSHAAGVANAYVQAQQVKELVRLLFAYLRRHIEGNEEIIGALIPQVMLRHAELLVNLLKERADEAAIQALRHANEHEDEQLRLNLLEWRAQRAPQEVAPEVEALARSGSVALRMRALQLAVRYDIPGMMEFVRERMRRDDFYELPYSERRLIFDVAIRQDLRQTHEVAVSIVGSHGIAPNPTRDTTRLLALEVINAAPLTPAALDALEIASKRRPWNSKELQEAAAAILKRQRGGR